MNQFRVLLKEGMEQVKDEELTDHLTKIGLDPHEFQIGANKVSQVFNR